MTGSPPRIADIIPRLQLRGAEIFAQYLEVALRNRYESALFPLFGAGEGPTVADHLRIVPGSPSHASRIGALRAVRALRRNVGTFRPDIVVAHGGDPLRAATLARLHREASPIVYLRVSSVPPHQRTGRRGRSLRAAYSHVAAFVAVSDSLRDELESSFAVPASKIRVIPNGRPKPSELSPDSCATLRAEAGARPGQILVAWSGRLVTEKDPLAAVALADRLRSHTPAIRLVMIGDGPLAGEVKGAAKGLDNVTFAGERSDAAALIGACDMLLSTSETEGAPGVMIEALLAGVPVVAPDVGGVAETVTSDAGVLTTSRDADALADAVAMLVGDESLRRELSVGALAAGERFDIRLIADEFDALYSELLAPFDIRRPE